MKKPFSPRKAQSSLRAAIALLVLSVSLVTFTVNAQSFLRANGSKIVDANNNEVVLRGMGLGGWLLMEGYARP